MSKVFHHGGRIGDMIFALYTMKALGGGQLVVSDYHIRNWSLEVAETMRKFLMAQSYVGGVQLMDYDNIDHSDVDYDLQHAEDDKNPEAFPEWHGGSWPGNCNIRKRYAVHFKVDYDPEAVWLTAPHTRSVEVAVHIPQRRSIRTSEDWREILERLAELRIKTVVLGEEGIGAYDLLESADYINSAKVFLGVVSSCNALAEGLGKRRLVEQASDCYNVNADGGRSCSINGMSNQDVVALTRLSCAV